MGSTWGVGEVHREYMGSRGSMGSIIGEGQWRRRVRGGEGLEEEKG